MNKVLYRTKLVARSHLYNQHFEFIAEGVYKDLESFVLGLSSFRRKSGFTGDFLSDIMYTNFVLIYSASPLNVSSINVPANSFKFDSFEYTEVKV